VPRSSPSCAYSRNLYPLTDRNLGAAGDPPGEPGDSVARPGGRRHAEADQVRGRSGTADVAARGHDRSEVGGTRRDGREPEGGAFEHGQKCRAATTGRAAPRLAARDDRGDSRPPSAGDARRPGRRIGKRSSAGSSGGGKETPSQCPTAPAHPLGRLGCALQTPYEEVVAEAAPDRCKDSAPTATSAGSDRVGAGRFASGPGCVVRTDDTTGSRLYT
jgi:hypothetical protein